MLRCYSQSILRRTETSTSGLIRPPPHYFCRQMPLRSSPSTPPPSPDHTTELSYACHVKELIVKKSRFIAHAGPAASSADALAFIAAVSEADASHNCWAFAVGSDVARKSDDGEPSGTAGVPILAAIERAGLDNAVVCVVRYFGGTKLGAGGLARAYGESAAACLAEAPRRQRMKTVDVDVEVLHMHVGAVLKVLRAHRVLDVAYNETGAVVSARIEPASGRDEVEDALKSASKGSAVCRLRTEESS